MTEYVGENESKDKVNMPMVSVIIPVYNSEDFLDEMLDSVAGQTYTDFEVICVNDGSVDGTEEIIKSFCAKDERFTCITKENGGAGTARNAGLDIACGKYVMFLDADDKYSTDLLKEMVTAAEKYQVDEVFCLYDEYDYKAGTYRRDLGFNAEVFPENTPIYTRDIKNMYFHIGWGPTSELFLRELIEKYNLRFSASKVANDVFFIKAYASVTKTMLGLHKHLLTHRRYINEGSLTHQRGKHTEDNVSALNELYDWLNANSLYEEYRDLFLKYSVSSVCYNGSFPLNHDYIEAMTDMICGKGLYDQLSEQDFYERYWKRYDARQLLKTIASYKEKNEPVHFGEQQYSNLLMTVKSIEKRAWEKYGRILNPYYGEQKEIRELKNKLRKTKKELKGTKKKLSASKKKEKQIRSSLTFRTGKAVTWLPRKVYKVFSSDGSRKHRITGHVRFFGKVNRLIDHKNTKKD